MQDYGLVSVITPSYNCARFIGATIESIQAQTYPNWELLITDDCSGDNTIEIIKKYSKKDCRIKFFRLDKNSGAGVARNNSIKQARGRFIAFCDSDDRWMPDKLEKQVAFMIKQRCTLSYTSYSVCSEVGEMMGVITCKSKIGYWHLVRDNCIGCLTAMYDTESFGKIFMPAIRKRQDWGLWLIMIKKCKYAYGIKQPLAIYRQRIDSISAKKINLIAYNLKVYKEVLHFSAFKSIVFFMFLFMPTYIYKKWKQK